VSEPLQIHPIPGPSPEVKTVFEAMGKILDVMERLLLLPEPPTNPDEQSFAE